MKKKRKTKRPVARKTVRRRSKKPASARLVLTPAERDLLMLACRRYRHDLPSYLEAAHSELGLVQGLIRRLS